MEQSNILLEDIKLSKCKYSMQQPKHWGPKKKKKTLKTLQLAIDKHALYKICIVSKHLCFLGLFSASWRWLMIYITEPSL